MIFKSFETVYVLKNSQSQYKKKMIDSLRRRYARAAWLSKKMRHSFSVNNWHCFLSISLCTDTLA